MFKKGDVLVGDNRKRDEAYHPIIYISGPDFAPLAVVLTHSDPGVYKCNVKLAGSYGKKASYFVAHLIEKMSDWGPYKKIGRLTEGDIGLVERYVEKLAPITWAEYQNYVSRGCPDHT